MASKDRAPKSRTIMWCVPRTVSTAITKCLSAIEDIQIWFQPYRFCGIFAETWKRCKDSELPTEYSGNESEYQDVVDVLTGETSVHFKPDYLSYASAKRGLESASSPHVFVKETGSYKGDMSYFPHGYKHTFLIRHPLRAMYSYRKATYGFSSAHGTLKGSAADEATFDVEQDDPYFSNFAEDQYTLWKYVRDNIDSQPIVIDSDDLLANPAEVLSKYCRAIGLPYSDSLLKWDASDDVVKRWIVPGDDLLEHSDIFLGTAFRSSGFFASGDIPSPDHVTPDVIRYTDRVLKYFEEMYESRIK